MLGRQLGETQHPLDGRYSLRLDRPHRLGVRADDGVGTAANQPTYARDVGRESVHQVQVDRRQLAGGVDPPQHRSDLETVAPQHEDDSWRAVERCLQLRFRLHGRTTWEVAKPADYLVLARYWRLRSDLAGSSSHRRRRLAPIVVGLA